MCCAKSKSFLCHFTGKDGVTPRRRNELLRFFDLVNKLENNNQSPTPLWYEIISSKKGHVFDWVMVHAQLSNTVAVFIEISFPRSLLDLINHPDDRSMSAVKSVISELEQYTNLTSYLQQNPWKITPTILKAYQESRSEFALLNKLYRDYHK